MDILSANTVIPTCLMQLCQWTNIVAGHVGLDLVICLILWLIFLSTDGSEGEKTSFPEEMENLENDSAGQRELEISDPSDTGIQDSEDEPLVIYLAFHVFSPFV